MAVSTGSLLEVAADKQFYSLIVHWESHVSPCRIRPVLSGLFYHGCIAMLRAAPFGGMALAGKPRSRAVPPLGCNSRLKLQALLADFWLVPDAAFGALLWLAWLSHYKHERVSLIFFATSKHCWRLVISFLAVIIANLHQLFCEKRGSCCSSHSSIG